MRKLFNNVYKIDRDAGSGGFGYSYLLKRARGNILLSRLGEDVRISDEYATRKSQ